MAEQWPTINGHASNIWCGYGAHICDVPDCPGPKLVAKLEAAEKMANVLRRLLKLGADETTLLEALSAWESASAPVETKAEEKMG